MLNKINNAEKANQTEKATEAAEAAEVKKVALETPVEAKGADDVEAKKFKNQGIRGPTLQPLGMDPRQAKALGILALGDDDGLDKLTAEQQLDDIWFSLSDKQRVVIGRAERPRARSPAMASTAMRLTRRPASRAVEVNSKRTRWWPAGSRTPRKRWFVGTIGAGAPSTVARQAG